MTALAICLAIAAGVVLMGYGVLTIDNKDGEYFTNARTALIVGLIVTISGSIASVFYMT